MELSISLKELNEDSLYEINGGGKVFEAMIFASGTFAAAAVLSFSPPLAAAVLVNYAVVTGAAALGAAIGD